MDNPAVNQRMAKDFGAKLKMLTGGKEMMLEFGACPLFPVNTSIHKGLQYLDIGIDQILASLHSFFKNSP